MGIVRRLHMIPFFLFGISHSFKQEKQKDKAEEQHRKNKIRWKAFGAHGFSLRV